MTHPFYSFRPCQASARLLGLFLIDLRSWVTPTWFVGFQFVCVDSCIEQTPLVAFASGGTPSPRFYARDVLRDVRFACPD